MLSIKVDIGSVVGNISNLKPTVQRQMALAIERVAAATRDKVVEYAGAGHPNHPNTVTGQLRSSTVYEMNGEYSAVVKTTSPYAGFVEYGHSQEPGRFVPELGKRLVATFVPPYPFFRPAVDDMSQGLAMAIFVKTIREVIHA